MFGKRKRGGVVERCYVNGIEVRPADTLDLECRDRLIAELASRLGYAVVAGVLVAENTLHSLHNSRQRGDLRVTSARVALGVDASAAVTALETRVAQLECAAKGHGATRTVAEPDAREQVQAYAKESAIAGALFNCALVTGLVQGTRTTVTCLDCGATISDDWKAKEVDDDSKK